MSEVQTEAAAAEAKPAKAKTEYTTVQMKDGREVKFAGKRKVMREVLKDESGAPSGVRFDYVNGHSHAIHFHEIPRTTALDLLAHGVSQKVGDESSGTTEIDDIISAHEDMVARLKKGEFYTERAAGDSFAGAGIVVRAIAEVTGKSIDAVKAFLNGKLETAKAKGEKLSRQDLYASFKNPNSKTGAVIERMEKEARAKASKLSADDLIAEVEEQA